MKEQKIIDSNWKIIEFMKIKPSIKEIQYDNRVYYDFAKLLGYNYSTSSNNFRFDESWDWLMPVIKEIKRSDCIITINFALAINCSICKCGGKNKKIKYFTNEGSDSLRVVYDTAVEYIDYYLNKKLIK